MALKGQAKTNYQRNYMRKMRALIDLSVRPKIVTPFFVRPKFDALRAKSMKRESNSVAPPVLDADGNIIPEYY